MPIVVIISEQAGFELNDFNAILEQFQEPKETYELKLAQVEACLEHIKIDDLPDIARPVDILAKNLFTKNAPTGRGRGPPHRITERITFNSSPGPLGDVTRHFKLSL